MLYTGLDCKLQSHNLADNKLHFNDWNFCCIWLNYNFAGHLLTNLDRGPVRVDEPERRDVCAAILELLHVDQVEVEAGDQEVVVGRHHAHRLGLSHHSDHVLDFTVEHDVDLSRLLHLSQYPP